MSKKRIVKFKDSKTEGRLYVEAQELYSLLNKNNEVMKKNNLRVFVTGDKDFNNYYLFQSKVTEILEVNDFFDDCKVNVEIVTNGISGIDCLCERYVKEMELPMKKFVANWNIYGNSAGSVCNEMAMQYTSDKEYKGVLVAFWDGENRLTKNIIKSSQQKGLFVRVIKY